ncbi:MAG TPA: glycogen debranching N-terminal domain-containing protein [Candidatus Dormibacteraeota bacterium]|nr:glycogen debranching N-terminal domain-containing protein [Candidatus Dormibacteraeota bacterium]
MDPTPPASDEAAAHASHSPTDLGSSLSAKWSSVFAITSANGDIDGQASRPDGIYFHDTRFLNRWALRVNGEALCPLLSDATGGTLVFQLTNPDIQLRTDGMLERHRVGVRRELALREEVVETVQVANFSRSPIELRLEYEFGADFEDMFVVRGERRGRRGKLHPPAWEQGHLRFRYDGADGRQRSALLGFSPEPDSRDGCVACFRQELPPGGHGTIRITVSLLDEGGGDLEKSPQAPTGRPFAGVEVETDNQLFDRTLRQAFDDLRTLVTRERGATYFAAGVPWFVALFGRDSLITSLQTLPFDPSIAAHTLEILARYQGTEVDDYRDEQPGKIVHELRVGEMATLGEVPHVRYYGTVDATPLFVAVVAEYVRWTGDLDLWRRLRPNVERALDWVDRFGDGDGDGFTDYRTRSSRGSRNQGWKDSDNAIVNRDGSLAQPPIALVEVQGYVYRAWLDAAWLLRLDGEETRADELEARAHDLQQRFRDAYWMPGSAYLALARESGGQLADSITSNPGHALWSGIVSPEHARAVADRLMGESMFSGWGIRTLAEGEAAYNPVDYQVGAVWPHDNGLIAGGLKRYGRDGDVLRVFTALFDAATRFERYRLPELFAGFSRDSYPSPVRYPVACSPQAWACGSLVQLLVTTLGLRGDATRGVLVVERPRLPDWLDRVTLRGVQVGHSRLTLSFQRSGTATLVAIPEGSSGIDLRVHA